MGIEDVLRNVTCDGTLSFFASLMVTFSSGMRAAHLAPILSTGTGRERPGHGPGKRLRVPGVREGRRDGGSHG